MFRCYNFAAVTYMSALPVFFSLMFLNPCFAFLFSLVFAPVATKDMGS